MAKILKRQDLAQCKTFRATFAKTEQEIAKLAKKVEEYNKLVSTYAMQRKTFEDTFLYGFSVLDVVVPKDGTHITNVNSMMANPLGINTEGKFDLDLLKYNLEHKTDYKTIPTEEQSTETEAIEVNQETETEKTETEF